MPADTVKRILLVSPVPSHPPITGSAIRPTFLAPQLRAMGWEVHFLHIDYSGGDLAAMREFWGAERFHYVPFRRGNLRWELRRAYRRLRLAETPLARWIGPKALAPADPSRVRPRVDDYYDPALGAAAARLHERFRFQAVVTHFVIVSRVLESFPAGVRRIIDTQEVFALGREDRAAQGERMWIDITPEDELRALRRGDFLWTSQQHEAAVLQKYFGERAMMVSHFVLPVEAVDDTALRARNILFVASKHRANVEGLEWFAREVYPHLQSWLKPEQVVVAGNIRGVLGHRLPFRFLGPVDDLAPLYRNARLAISPILTGTGLKCKNVDAFAFGKPVVTTCFGAMGMEHANGVAQLAAETPVDFAAEVTRLMNDDALCRRMMHNALGFAHEWNRTLSARMAVCIEEQSHTGEISLSGGRLAQS
jgi:glycosyltransferase involved in cell wall biosynthesis